MSEKEYIIVVKRGVNLEEFDAEMSASQGHGPIPNRSVEIANPRLGSKRMTHWMITDAEADQIRHDPRVLSVEIPPDQRDDIQIGLNASQTGSFTRNSNIDANHVNWGLRRSSNLTNIYGSNESISGAYNYPVDGSGVDVVIQDSGIQADHPEFEDAQGNSRVQQIDWYSESGLVGTQDSGFYTDYDGHGTHCAGIAAGKTYGWAKGAAIYAQKLGGLEGTSDPGFGISISDAFDAIRLWHSAKTNSRPTVVNMSWGYTGTRTTLDGGTYRGVGWTYGQGAYTNDNTVWQLTGIVPKLGGAYRVPVRVASVDAEIEDMIDSGIHVCIAAGNSYYKVDLDTGADYNNTADFGGGNEFYHRGSSPYSLNAFMVGNIDSSTVSGVDKARWSSTKGPGINIWAPGTNIMSATSNTNSYDSQGLAALYPPDNNFKIAKIGGTSMASPQVAGIVALIAGIYPSLTPEEMQEKILNDAGKGVVYDTGGGGTDYNVADSNLGSPNVFVYSPYNTDLVFEMRRGVSMNSLAPTINGTPEDFSAPTITATVTNSGTSNYVFTGDITGNDPTINLQIGQTISLNLNAPGHPFWIKTSQVTGQSNGVAGVTNNGVATGTISWTPDTPGTYYYICEFHSGMTGQIVVA